MKLIDKIKAEIERIRNQSAKELGDAFLDSNEPKVMASGGITWTCEQLLSFLDTLEVKEAQEEPEEELEGEIKRYLHEIYDRDDTVGDIARHFAKWQKEQMMSKAIVREVKVDAGGYPYIDTTELYDYDKDMPLAKEGDKVKILVIKE